MRTRLICVSTTPSIDRFGEVDVLRLNASKEQLRHEQTPAASSSPGFAAATRRRKHLGEIHRPQHVAVHPGGKGLNVARAAAILGGSVVAVALFGGHSGRWIAEMLPRYGVRGEFAWSREETRSCLSIFDHATGHLTDFFEPAARVTSEEWAGLETALEASLDEALERMPPHHLLVTISGTRPPGAPPGSHGRLVDLAARNDIRVIVDVYGPALGDALDSGTWLVKANAAEAQDATGVAIVDLHGAIRAARILVGEGARSALITLGARGAVMVDTEGTPWAIGVPPVDAMYPVGSGDAFLAGLAMALLDGAAPPVAATRSAGAAAANTELPAPGVLDRARALELASLVVVARIDPTAA